MPPETLSLTVLLTLLLICGASIAMFSLLVRRWTTQRQWTTLREWARLRRFRFAKRGQSKAPGAFTSLLEAPVHSVLELHDDRVIVAQLQTQADRWNVLMRKSPTPRATAGLRPMNAPASLLDRLSLHPFPSLTVGHRFTLLGADSAAARALADSASRTLLPQDIGLLVADEWVVLDFSSRPFDPIELDRMLALAQQLSQLG